MRKPNVEERRAEILETTIQVVIERGFGAIRIVDVADRLGVSTGLIHYHFDSKEQLLAEAFQFAAEADLARLNDAIDQGGSAVDRLTRVFNLYAQVEAEPGWMLWIDGWGEALRSDTLRRISQDLDAAWQQQLEKLIAQGVTTGELRCSDPHATAWRLVALLDGLGLQVTVHGGLLTRQELLHWVHDLAARELGLPAGAFAGAEITARQAR
ncbi:MAG TPA: TetR family transcriptional regulator C-terminal domain-containing protein [Acidimicrobiales bacterium]